ncbi:hypothetical protein ABBQ32_013502 [Trebouxia sp. C0010 RCD-2024]
MHEHYPLTEQLWLEWLQDEIDSADSSAGKKQIEQLFRKAVQDYLSVPIWKAYMEFAKSSLTDPTDGDSSVQHFREVCEQALTAAGLHITLGASLWNTYREHEAQLAAADPTADTQQQRVGQLYQRQLLVPLADAAQTLQGYRQWEAQLAGATQPPQVPDHVEQGFKKAQQAVSLRSEHEAMVASDKPADENLLAAFLAYIKYEEAKGDPPHVQLLYERALAAFPVTTYLWQAYANYMQDHIKVPAATQQIYTRALRNCPWVGSLWANALRALELHNAFDEQQHTSLYSSALQAGLQTAEDYMEVVLARLDGLRHMGTDRMQALRQGFQQGAELMQTYFPEYMDRSLRLHAYWADCELHIGKDATAAEAVWENVLRSPMGRYIEPSIAYVTMLVGSGNHAQARHVFKRGYARNLEEKGQVFLCEAWLRFEREHGTADSYAEACRKVRPFLEQAAAAAAAAANTEGTAKAQAAAKKAKKLTPEEMKKMRQQADPNYQAKQAAAGTPTPYADGPSKKGKKAKTAAGQPEAASVTASKAARHKLPDAGSKPGGAASTHMAAQTAAQAQADQSAASNNKRRQGLGFAEEQPQPKRAKPTPPDPAAADNTDSVQHAQQAPANSNPQEKLPSSKVVDEQPSQTKAGLQKQSAAPQAAGASSGPPRRHQPAAAAAAAQQGPLAVFTDECTAFVRGLDNKVTEAELKQLLAACGQVKDVRLVMDKATGRPKGFGYVEFGSNSALQKAVDLKDPELHGRKMTIMVSKPPSGGPAGRGRGGPARGFGGGRGDKGRSIHQHERLAVSAAPAFMPRAVAKKTDVGKTPTATNADFRQLLHKK